MNKKKIIIISLSAFAIICIFTGLIIFANKRQNNEATSDAESRQETTAIKTDASKTTSKKSDKESSGAQDTTEETSEAVYEVVEEAVIDQFFEEVINDEDEVPLELPSREFDNSVTPYDGKYRSISCYGDSMMEGVGCYDVYAVVNGTNITGWNTPYALQQLSGIKTYNFGVGSEDSSQIAFRAGAYILHTDRDVQISETQSATVQLLTEDGEAFTTDSDYSGYGNETNAYPNCMYIGGYLCKVTNVNDSEVSICLASGYLAYNTVGAKTNVSSTTSLSTYNANADGSSSSDSASENSSSSSGSASSSSDASQSTSAASDSSTGSSASTTAAETTTAAPVIIGNVTIAAGAEARTKSSVDHADDILILEIGSNGGWDSDYQTLIRQYDAIINNSGAKYYIIVGDTDDPGTSVGDENQGETDDDGNYIGIGDTAWESALREAYGDHFFNTRVYLIENGLDICGLKTTTNDLENYKKGALSEQLRVDWTHFNAYGYYAKAYGIYEKGKSLGYW